MAKTQSKSPKKREQRKRTKHPGVTLLDVAGRGLVARWKDPVTGAPAQKGMKSVGATNRTKATQWCIKKHEEITKQKYALSLGQRPTETVEFDDAIETWMANKSMSPKTGKTYRSGMMHFLAWAKKRRVASLDKLTPEGLVGFRDYVWKMKRLVPKTGRGSGRGATKATDKELSPDYKNIILRTVKTFLNDARRRGWLRGIHSDDIADALPKFRAPTKKRPFLKPAAIKKLLEACIRHDNETWAMTREEKAAGAKPRAGETKRYDPIGPLIVAYLLTGCRVNELLSLRWDHVDEQEQVIRLQAENVKTKTDREVHLKVCPSMIRMFETMRLRSTGPLVFGGDEPRTKHWVKSSVKRLITKYGAPKFSPQDLRCTAGTFLACAPGIYAGASHIMSAFQLGHTPDVALKHYQGRMQSIPHDATTLEAAMGCEDLILAAMGLAPNDVSNSANSDSA